MLLHSGMELQKYIAHSEPLHKSLNILKIPDIFTCSLWKFYYKLLKNQLPTYVDDTDVA